MRTYLEDLNKQDLPEDKEKICSDCGGTDIIYDSDSGEYACRNCGLIVYIESISQGLEYSVYSYNEEGRRRVGKSVSLLDVDVGSVIKIGRDATGKDLKENVRRRLHVLKRCDDRSKGFSSKDRNLNKAVFLTREIGRKLNIPKNALEQSMSYYRKALDNDMMRGRTIEGFVVVCLYNACRKYNIPKTIKDFINDSNVSNKEFHSVSRLMIERLNIKIDLPSPADFIPRIISNLEIFPFDKSRIEQFSIDFVEELKYKKMTGRKPIAIAATLIYIACKKLEIKGISQKSIADAAGVTEVTIRNVTRNFEELGIVKLR